MGKFRNLILQELGNTTESYNYRISSSGRNMVAWEFRTPLHHYVVNVRKVGKYMSVNFVTKEDGVDTTEANNQFKVTSTILDIAKDSWERKEELFANGGSMIGFKYDALPRRGESEEGGTARENLYQTFIKTQFPGAEIKRGATETKVIPNG